MTNILSAVWSPLEFENAYDHYVSKQAVHESAELLSFEDFYLEALADLPPIKIRYEAVSEMTLLPTDFDEIDKRFLRQFPRKSAGNVGAGNLDGTPVTGKGHRISHDPS